MTREDLLNALATDALRQSSLKEARLISRVKNRVERHHEIEERAKQLLIQASEKLNQFEEDFFFLSKQERFYALYAEHEKSVVGHLFADALSMGSYAANMHMLIKLTQQFGDTSVITIQISDALSPAKKTDMLQSLETQDAMVIFQTNPSLLGGLRLFFHGRMIDKTVRGRITQLFNQFKKI